MRTYGLNWAYERIRTLGEPMNIPFPTATAEPEEPVRRTPAQRAAEWRARQAEEAAELRRRADLDAAIVDCLVSELAEQAYANRAAGIEGPARVGAREILAAVLRRGGPVIQRQELARQLHARLAPNMPNPYGAPTSH